MRVARAPIRTVRRRLVATPDGEVTVAVTVPVWVRLEKLVTSPFSVSDDLEKSAAFRSTTCELLSASGPAVCSWMGNWMPVLLSGGICIQSTLSSVNIVFGLFG